VVDATGCWHRCVCYAELDPRQGMRAALLLLLSTQGAAAMSQVSIGCHAALPAWQLYVLLSAS
jgi:hypothetical protein